MRKIWLLVVLIGSITASLQSTAEHSMHSQPWRPVQERTRDTVVQIFVYVAEIDILRPYEAPEQKGLCGSGFFINNQGDIITNAHVVNQAVGIYIQIPSIGKRFLKVKLICICPERDIALLRVSEQDLAVIAEQLGAIPFLPLGDSDMILRSDVVMALGYPLAQQSLKSTTGVISGHERDMLQISAPINPGSSGGPLLNINGEVIGINTAGIVEAQNVGYAIPINELKVILDDMYNLDDMYKTKLLRKPYLGLLTSNATESLTKYLDNPLPGGCYVVEVIKNSPLYNAGVRRGDMIYEINGNRLDIYGEMNVPWSEDKISVVDYVSRLKLDDEVHIVLYRRGERTEIVSKVGHLEQPAIRRVYPGYEPIECEIFAGMVVMPLSLNHIDHLLKHAPGLLSYTEIGRQSEPVLIITHIFQNSQLYNARVISPGIVIRAINGVEVHTLEDFRNAIKTCAHEDHLIIRASDTITQSSDNLMVGLPLDQVFEEEQVLSRNYRYPLASWMEELIAQRQEA
jgi:serine protease Do